MLQKQHLEQGVSQSELARRFGIDRTTIWRWVRTGQLDRDLSAGSNGYSPRAPVMRKLDPASILHDRAPKLPDPGGDQVQHHR
ncbi:MAG: helix-turn-helix domain-containing protein [Boseongicola sp.]|nr:helix-turn-helix domain-containing protein [Boseongicola sp.]